jgi:4'-phosphopantetheinyl transferase
MNEWLSAEEQAKAGRFRQPIDRQRFVLGRGLVRVLAAEQFDMDPGSLVFVETANGKPSISGGGFEFSVSHSGDWVLVAWSESSVVGADVEAMNSKNEANLSEIASISFSAPERAVLEAALPDEKAAVFHRIWVRKEAIIKAEGVGLGGALQDFSVVRLNGSVARWAEAAPYPGSARSWRLVDLTSPVGCFAALAVEPGATVCEGALPAKLATVAS